MNAQAMNGTLTDQGPRPLAAGADVPGGGEAAPRRVYRPPRVRHLGDAADLLEVLGPAQGNYGGFA
jgi:hypothetical protein